MKALAALAVALTASASSALACDVGAFPNLPDRLAADVIVVGRVDKVTEAFDAKGLAQGSAEITIERVAVGTFSPKTYRLDYPLRTPADWCVITEGPDPRLGRSVAIYFYRKAGELKVEDWFWAEEAQLADPRLAKAAPLP